MTKNIYYVSGLGADERVFTFLKIENANETFIKWLEPNKKESLDSYSKRLIDQIDRSKPIILIGVSFGGIVVQEIAKHIQVEKLIIISSVKSFKDYGLNLKLASFTKIYKIVPSFILKWSNKLTADYYFGTESKEESKLLNAIINDTDERFMVWAIDKIMQWKNFSQAKYNIIHIQGSKDRIFTNRNIDNTIWIKGGGHFMIVNKANEISDIINQSLAKM
ncbi:alpha/beta hydrolase [Aquimarina algiphila]|uniref:Alpha/beta hydrolase n=1 Tax=Aquimarina algiphila TaxID=2047982 RepID=A0A554VKE8_9FLAO|nr:alpha/beta hydrolase [Aquimarina algiphila]TSE08481.1 alpha/beta hydrolase [Aquimarina algiphila]